MPYNINFKCLLNYVEGKKLDKDLVLSNPVDFTSCHQNSMYVLLAAKSIDTKQAK